MWCFICYVVRKLKKKKLLYNVRWFETISRPEKSQEILVKRACNITIIFYVCLISPISCVRLINEWQSDDRSQSRVACRDFLELWQQKKREKFVFLTSKFPRRESEQIRKNKPKVRSLNWVMVFLVAENENRQLEDLRQADFGRVHENISFVGKEKVNNWEFCEKKAMPIVCFCNGSTHFFHLEPYRRHAIRLFLRIVKPIISYFKKDDFSSQ